MNASSLRFPAAFARKLITETSLTAVMEVTYCESRVCVCVCVCVCGGGNKKIIWRILNGEEIPEVCRKLHCSHHPPPQKKKIHGSAQEWSYVNAWGELQK